MSRIDYENYCILIKPAEMILEMVSPSGPTVELEDMYKWLQCDMIETVQLGRNTFLVIDEEGRIKYDDGKHPNGYFTISSFPEVLCGRGLIVGIKGSDMVGTHLTIQDVAPLVKWFAPGG